VDKRDRKYRGQKAADLIGRPFLRRSSPAAPPFCVTLAKTAEAHTEIAGIGYLFCLTLRSILEEEREGSGLRQDRI
jgi:hypothetical protein